MNYDHPWLRSLSKYDWDYLKRFVRRYSRRRTATTLALLVLFLYLCLRRPSEIPSSSSAQCLAAKVAFWNDKLEGNSFGANVSSVFFVGNGYFSVDKDSQLRFGKGESTTQTVAGGFWPIVSSDPEGTFDISEEILTDFENGIVYNVKCFSVENECVCISSSIFVHRTRPEVFVQEVKVTNPTKTTIRLKSERKSPDSSWIQSESKVFTRIFPEDPLKVAAVICTESEKISIAQKREETIRFTCIVQSENLPNSNVEKLKEKTINGFRSLPDSLTIDREHGEGWRKIHEPYYGIEKSLAPDILNGDRINATKYIILSNSVFKNDGVKELQLSLKTAQSLDHCYTGHSTLLYPSRLWEDWQTVESLLELADTWKITLEKRGCGDTVKLGAFGISYAFVQSLAACSYHDSHLEVGLDAADLHRSMSFGGIPIYGAAASVVGFVDVAVNIDTDNRPYFQATSTAELYACEAGCLSDVVLLGKNPTRIPVKVTKPITSLLYVATNRKHLHLLKSAIHVSEVGAAPAHEQELLDLHKSGGSGGLPMHFWVFLITVLIIFHLFLAKLLWNEWRKDDMTPYNPYLKSRYSSMRSH